MPAKTERFELSLGEDSLARLDQWCAAQDDLPSRSEAIHRLLRKALLTAGELKFTKPEKLMLSMLCDISKHLNITDASINPDFLADAVLTGNPWALTWVHKNLLTDEDDAHEVEVDFVADVLQMWTYLERSYDKLSKEQQEQIKKQVTLPPFSKFLKFPGFDGNYEAQYYSIMDFLVNSMDRFVTFKNRDLVLSFPMSEIYARMLPVYKRTLKKTQADEFTPQEIIAILNARNVDAAAV